MHKNTTEQGLFELYQNNPDEADYLLFGRETYPDRRGFLKKAGLAVMGAMVGAAIPFHRNIPGSFYSYRACGGGYYSGQGWLDRAQ